MPRAVILEDLKMANGNDYEQDPIKEKSRKEIYRFADKHLPKDRSQATAIYLASDNPKESELLDKLGFPREGRLILEGDPAKVEAVRLANPGINVLPMTTHQFFASPEAQKYAPWWYCGLDYECTLNSQVDLDLLHIGMNNLLKDGAILYTNIVGQREKEETQRLFIGSIIAEFPPAEQKRLLGEDFNFGEIFERVKRDLPEEVYRRVYPGGRKDETAWTKEFLPRLRGEVVNSIPEPNLKRIRDKAISARVYGDANYSLFGLEEIHFADVNCAGAREVVQRHDAKIYCQDAAPRLTKGNFWVVAFGGLIDQIQAVFKAAKEAGGASFDLFFDLEDNARDYFKRGGLPIIPAMFSQAYRGGYVAVDPYSMSYTSRRRTHMMIDMFQARQTTIVRNFLENLSLEARLAIFYGHDRPYLAEIKDTDLRSLALLEKKSRKLNEMMEKELGFLFESFQYQKQTPARKYLGNSSLPLLTLSAARKCALENISDEQIAEKYHVSNWGRMAAVRANVTMGKIKPKPPAVKKYDPKEPESEQVGCKHLVSRDIYRNLSRPLKMRLDYFIGEVVEPLRSDKQNRIRQAFRESRIGEMIENSIEPIRFYAFLDDVQLAIAKGQKLTPEFLDDTYRHWRDAKRLNEIVEHPQTNRRTEEVKPKKKGPSEQIKTEVRELLASGMPREEVWEAYKGNFDSRIQFGAVTAWISPNLAKRRAR